MYYLLNEHKGFSSTGKLFNYISQPQYLRRCKLGCKQVTDSLGNKFLAEVEFVCIDKNRLHKDLVIEKNGSDGRVLIKRYFSSKITRNPLYRDWIETLCDPPIELCKIKIH